MQFVVRERVRGLKLPAARARGALLAELARELRAVRDSHDHYKFGKLCLVCFNTNLNGPILKITTDLKSSPFLKHYPTIHGTKIRTINPNETICKIVSNK